MLHHYYYIDGKRVSEDRYVAVKAREEYEKFAFEKAKEYFKTHEFQWYQLCMSTPEKDRPRVMIYQFESTPQGEACRKEWDAKVKRSEKFSFVLLGMVLLLFVFATVSICAGHA